MIDFIKISTTQCDFKKLIESQIIQFTYPPKLVSTNEVAKNKYGNLKYHASYNGWQFCINEDRSGNLKLFASGSLHKLFNNGHHNFNDFNIQDISEAIDTLTSLCQIDPDKAILHNLEIGLNVEPPIKTSRILNGLLLHNSKRFKSYIDDKANYHQVIHSSYIIKCYDKALQYRRKGFIINNEILRFEIKHKKMYHLIKDLQKEGLLWNEELVLNNLKSLIILNFLCKQLIEKWNEIIAYDYTIQETKLSKSIIIKLPNWQNVNYWENLYKEKRYREKSKMYRVIENSSEEVQLQLSVELQGKALKLLQQVSPIAHVT